MSYTHPYPRFRDIFQIENPDGTKRTGMFLNVFFINCEEDDYEILDSIVATFKVTNDPESSLTTEYNDDEGRFTVKQYRKQFASLDDAFDYVFDRKRKLEKLHRVKLEDFVNQGKTENIMKTMGFSLKK